MGTLGGEPEEALDVPIANLRKQLEERFQSRRSKQPTPSVQSLESNLPVVLGENAFHEERRCQLKTQETLHILASRCDQVQCENQRLRAQLEAKADAQLISNPAEELECVKEELNQCKRDIDRAMRARGILETKCRHYKEIQKEWRAYNHDWILRHPRAEGNTERGELHGDPLPVNVTNRNSSSAPAPPSCPATTTSLNDESPPTSSRPKKPPHLQKATTSNCGGEESRVSPIRFLATQACSVRNGSPHSNDHAETTDESGKRPESGHTTNPHGQIHLDQPHKIEPSIDHCESETPIFISERSLKRKKPVRASIMEVQVHEDIIPQYNHQSAKIEQLSSSPLQPLSRTKGYAAVGDSLDLDEIGGTLYTPRKKQRLEQIRLNSSMVASGFQPRFGNERLDGARAEDSEPSAQQQNIKEEADGLNNHPTVHTVPVQKEAQRKKVRKQAQIAQQNAHNERVHQRLLSRGLGITSQPKAIDLENCTPATLKGSKAGQRIAGAASSTTLQPTEPNTLPRTREFQAGERRVCPPSRRDRGAAYVPALAEDGEDPTPTEQNGIMALKSRRLNKAPDAHQRLGILLNDMARPETPLLSYNRSVRSALPALAPTTPHSLPPMRKPRGPIQTASKSAQQLTTNRRSAPSINGPSDVLPEHEPLRARPLHRLRLEDFKLNPKHSNFAYHETIRKHDDKKARNGCTDPFCQRCKDLKTFVEKSGYTAARKPNLFDSSPPDGAEDAIEERLLRDFLGGDAHRLSHMSEQEKKDTLLKARTKQFHDQFGKHRQGMSRAFEVPGFWNTDFPSTQENEQLREEARVMQRQKVEERLEEARRGGMWLFADEV